MAIDREAVMQASRSNGYEIYSAKITLFGHPHGKTFKGLCPFHDEATPSFVVWRETWRWNCFGCGQGGSIIDFVMKTYDVNFLRAVQIIAGDIPIDKGSPPPLAQHQKQWLGKAMDIARLWRACQQMQRQKNLCRDEPTPESRLRWKYINRGQQEKITSLESYLDTFDSLEGHEPPRPYFSENKTISNWVLSPDIQPFIYGSSEFRKNCIALIHNA
jgi:hypothetical protein